MKNLLQREGPFVPSTYEKHPGLFDSNIAVNFFFVCAVFKNNNNNGNVVYAKRNPLNASFDFFFLQCWFDVKQRDRDELFSLEEGGRANETALGCAA